MVPGRARSSTRLSPEEPSPALHDATYRSSTWTSGLTTGSGRLEGGELRVAAAHPPVLGPVVSSRGML